MTATEYAERYGLRGVLRLLLVLVAFLTLYPLRKLLLLAARVLEVAIQRLDTFVAPTDTTAPFRASADPPVQGAAA